MQCACPQCGALMVQSAHSNDPACLCTQCAAICRLCLGGNTRPLTREALRDGLSLHLLLNRRDEFDTHAADLDEDGADDEDIENRMERFRP